MLGKKVYSALNAKMVRNKVSLKAKQLSELRKALSEPTPAYDVDYRCWQKKDAIQFVKEKFKILYSDSRIRQIVNYLD